MAQDHISKDRVANVGEVRACQRVLSSTAKAMINMFGTGTGHGWRNNLRCMDNAGGEAEDAPVSKILPKVHKPPMAAATGISSRADFLKPLVLLTTPCQEDQSTEEVLSQLEDAQAAIQTSGSSNTMAGSLDVRELYPSLDQDGAAEVVAQLVLETDVNITSVNWRSIQVFLASNNTPDELKAQGLLDIVPDRLSVMGRRPGPTTPELSMKIPQDMDETPVSKWKPTDTTSLTNIQKKLLLSRAVKTAVKTIFRHHVYQFDGVYYIQLAGGPIGLRLTSVVAQIVMDRWSLLFLAKLDNTGWKIWAMMKYVDDVNLVIEMMDHSVGWKDGKLQRLTNRGGEGW